MMRRPECIIGQVVPQYHHSTPMADGGLYYFDVWGAASTDKVGLNWVDKNQFLSTFGLERGLNIRKISKSPYVSIL